MTFTASRSPWQPVLVFSVLLAGVDLLSVNNRATASLQQVPWECSNYTNEAQTRCLNAFIERQQEQIGKLERQLQNQQNMVGQLNGQIERQSAATAQLQQQLAQPPVTTTIVPHPTCIPLPSHIHPSASVFISGVHGLGPVIMGTMAGRGVRASTPMAITDDGGRLDSDAHHQSAPKRLTTTSGTTANLLRLQR